MREAIVLAGGFGTRLRSVVSDVPKPMAPVAGRPFLAFVLDELKRHAYTHIVLSTGYMHDSIEQAFGKEYSGMSVDYAVEHSPLGTGGAIVNAMQHCTETSVTVLNGDTLFRIDHERLISLATASKSPLTVALRQVPDASRYGSVEVDGEGRIVLFREKAEGIGEGLINGGIYRIGRHLLDGYSVGQPFSFERDLMQQRYATERFFAYAASGYFIDIGIPDDYHRAQTELPRL